MDAKSIKKKVDKIFENGLTDPQIEVLRQVLRENIKIDWNDNYTKAVREINMTISSMVSIPVRYEVVRRFAQNINDNNPRKPFNSSEETLRSIAYYLTHPDVECLDPAELENVHKIDYQAATRLAQFFHETAFDIGFAGRFLAEGTRGKGNETRRVLELRANESNKFYYVIESLTADSHGYTNDL